jgi:hypothetical protein
MARVELLVTVDKIVSSNLQPVSGGSVLVKLRSTGSPVPVYAAETGGTTISNPLVTDANGRVNGWVDEASLVLTISGSGITSYNQPYEATRADSLVVIDGARVAAGTMPGSSIQNNSIPSTAYGPGSILGKHLAESAMPLGTVLAWWQPTKPGGGFTIPAGFAVADGSTLGPAAHNFPGGGSVVLPNLIDSTLIGANPASAYNATGASVGMNGVAGSNLIDLSHVHAMPHTHNIAAHSHAVAAHSHYMDHTHVYWVPNHSHSLSVVKFSFGGSTNTAGHIGSTNTGGSNIGEWNGTTTGASAANTGVAAPSTSSQTGGTVTQGTNTPNTSAGLSSTQDIRQKSTGVIFIIKVKNTV